MYVKIKWRIIKRSSTKRQRKFFWSKQVEASGRGSDWVRLSLTERSFCIIGWFGIFRRVFFSSVSKRLTSFVFQLESLLFFSPRYRFLFLSRPPNPSLFSRGRKKFDREFLNLGKCKWKFFHLDRNLGDWRIWEVGGLTEEEVNGGDLHETLDELTRLNGNWVFLDEIN